ncbi:MAG: hydrolase [Dehalococcoidia bacterium]|nr:MAG: hydrolase [Dehalococcoidia bacterium]
MIGAVIFDLDGTLIDSFPGMIATAREVLAAAGLPAPPAERFERLMRRGLLLDELFLEFGIASEHVSDLMQDYRTRYAANAVLAVRPFPETLPCLKALTALGLPLAVATSKRLDMAQRALAAAGLLPYFRDVLGHDSVSRGKPHPEMVTTLAARLQVPPEGCLMVGDSLYDILMGHAAGARTCAVRCDALPTEELLAVRPHFIIDRLDELPPLVRLAS